RSGAKRLPPLEVAGSVQFEKSRMKLVGLDLQPFRSARVWGRQHARESLSGSRELLVCARDFPILLSDRRNATAVRHASEQNCFDVVVGKITPSRNSPLPSVPAAQRAAQVAG